MKKPFFISLLLGAFLIPLNAQKSDYRPLIEDGKTWISFNPDCLRDDNCSWWMGYIQYDKIEGDTIVNGQPCKFWNQRYVSCTDGLELFIKVPVYEENQKVWFFLDGDKEPRPAFDFGAEVGDTILAQSIQGLYIRYYWKYLSDKYDYAHYWSDTLFIKSKVKMEVGGREQKVFYYKSHLQNSDFYMQLVYLMEGIGSNKTSVQNIGPNVVGYTGIAELISCSVGDEILYFDPEAATRHKIPIPTSITAPSTLNSAPSSLNLWTDLSGRQLSPPTHKGIYIKDGKKVMVK